MSRSSSDPLGSIKIAMTCSNSEASKELDSLLEDDEFDEEFELVSDMLSLFF